MRLGLGLGLGVTAARVGEAAPVVTVPEAPTIGTATAGDGQVSITFTRNGNGGSVVDYSRATVTPGGQFADGDSPIVITGVSNDVEVTVKVKDHNAVGYSLESAASNAVTPEAPASGVAWDPLAMRFACTLSNGNLTASTDSASGTGSSCRGTLAPSTGKHVLRMQYNFGGAASDAEVECGLATAAWPWDGISGETAAAPGGDTTSWGYMADGSILHDSNFIATGLPALASGEFVDHLVNFDTGKVFIKTPAGVTGDPEAGTGEAFTFTPNTALYPAFWAYSNTGPAVSAVLVPAHTDGTFAAWS